MWVKHGLLSLCHFVVLLSESGLLVSCVVLMKETASNCLVELLNSELVKFGSLSLVTGINRSIELLDYSLELALNHLVLKCLSLVYEDTLLCRLDVSHFNSPYLNEGNFAYTMLSAERVRVLRLHN